MSPYRLEIREDLAPSDQMKVIKFWSSYVDFFLLMYKIEHTKSLQRAIEDLVVDSFEETCIMMRKFLDQIKGTGSIRDEPVFLQFLEFYYNNTPADEQRVSINAAISHFKESVQQKTLAYSNSEMIKQVVYWYADMIRQAVYSFSNMIKQAIIGKLKFL
ncbi:hypothetical protein DFH28DRAFT_505133 [Melampsora americana]|nr:hypothetical protein DFH28DRAFT_505133 [Melampsora americana]